MLNIYPSNIRALTFAIFVFVLLDLVILGLNVWISTETDKHVKELNIAGRQRMLSQRLTKELLIMASYDTLAREHLKDLTATHKLFNETIDGFIYGGDTLGLEGKRVALRAATHPRAVAALRQANQIWAWLGANIENLLNAGDSEREVLLQIAKFEALAVNLQLLELMDQLAGALEQQAQTTSANIRIAQLVVVILAVINFIVIVRQFLGHIEMSDFGREYLSGLINKINAAVIVTDRDGKVVNYNLQSVNLYGCSPAEMSSTNINRLIQTVDGEAKGRKQDGTSFIADLKQDYLELGDDSVVISTIRDITYQKLNEKSLAKLAYHDSLTNLPNRLLVEEHLNQDVARAHRYHQMLAVCFVDLDGFKQVNDTYGHQTGDELLLEVANQLRSCARESDTVGRLGGDEFVVVFSDVNSERDACALAEKLVVSVSGITRISGHIIEIGASVGIALYPHHSRNPEQLVKLADMAMYAAKDAGKSCWHLHNAEDPSTSLRA